MTDPTISGRCGDVGDVFDCVVVHHPGHWHRRLGAADRHHGARHPRRGTGQDPVVARLCPGRSAQAGLAAGHGVPGLSRPHLGPRHLCQRRMGCHHRALRLAVPPGVDGAGNGGRRSDARRRHLQCPPSTDQPRTWRGIHWMAYGSWPVAMAHSLGMGTDASHLWMDGLAAVCSLAVMGSLAWRISDHQRHKERAIEAGASTRAVPRHHMASRSEHFQTQGVARSSRHARPSPGPATRSPGAQPRRVDSATRLLEKDRS